MTHPRFDVYTEVIHKVIFSSYGGIQRPLHAAFTYVALLVFFGDVHSVHRRLSAHEFLHLASCSEIHLQPFGGNDIIACGKRQTDIMQLLNSTARHLALGIVERGAQITICQSRGDAPSVVDIVFHAQSHLYRTVVIIAHSLRITCGKEIERAVSKLLTKSAVWTACHWRT